MDDYEEESSYDDGEGNGETYDETNDEGSIEMQNEYYEDDSERRDDGPNEMDYEDYSDYVEARIKWQIQQSIQQGQPPGPMTFQQKFDAVAPDDAHFTQKRQEAIHWIEHCRHQEEKAKIAGDTSKARDWRQRLQWGVSDIEELGESEAEKFASDVGREIDMVGIKGRLMNPDEIGNPEWDTPKFVHDSSVVISRSNQNAKDGVIYLPKEISKHGNIEEVRPENMVSIELPEGQYEDWKNFVYNGSVDETDFDALFRRGWHQLHNLGFASQAEPVIDEDDIKDSDDPERMDYEKFAAWREAQEEKKRASKPVVIPRKRRRA